MYPSSFLQLVGGNAPVTLLEADNYFLSRTASDAWETFSEADREKALVSAAQQLSELSYKGYIKEVDQIFPFPRVGEYLDRTKGIYVSLDNIPERYVEAVFELAFHLLKEVPTRGATASSISIGPISLSGIRNVEKMPGDITRKLGDLLSGPSVGLVWRRN